jgi:hypothetical protein
MTLEYEGRKLYKHDGWGGKRGLELALTGTRSERLEPLVVSHVHRDEHTSL